MSVQAELLAARVINIDLSTHSGAPNNGYAATAPDCTMSPRTPTGMKTTGLFLGLSQPSVNPAAGPFTIVPWIFDPIGAEWFSAAALTAVDFNQGFITFDFDAAQLYFQITNGLATGNVYLHYSEQ